MDRDTFLRNGGCPHCWPPHARARERRRVARLDALVPRLEARADRRWRAWVAGPPPEEITDAHVLTWDLYQEAEALIRVIDAARASTPADARLEGSSTDTPAPAGSEVS